jgi:hypothetical protein
MAVRFSSTQTRAVAAISSNAMRPLPVSKR